MATITVVNTNNSGLGSLRDAIALASAGDTIVFDAALAGLTITLASELMLDKDITINGDIDGDRKADITISGNDTTRIFNINSSITGFGTVELRSLTLTEGDASASLGGAILAGFGTTLAVIDSTISESKASIGAGIFSDHATLRVVNSTLTGNEATLWGGGVLVFGGDASFVNATIHGNVAGSTGGGGIDASDFDTLTVLNSTITGNTSTGGAGGVHLFGDETTATIRNSVVAGNTGAEGEVRIGDSTLTAASSFFGTTVTITTDQGGNINNGGNPLLGALADNGGPVETRMPLAGSQLIGTGDAALLPVDTFDLDGDSNTVEKLPFDAAGHPRIAGALDIGATERVLIVTNTNDSGSGSLRQAILDANADPDHDTIVFASNLAGGTITLLSALPTLTTDVTILGDVNGDRKADITISGNDATRIFNITGAGTEVELRSLTLTQGFAASGSVGGAILAGLGTTLAVIDSTVSNSKATTTTGGGIFSEGATLQVVNSTLTGNKAIVGGGLYVHGGTASFVNSTIHDNHASGNGGGGIEASDGAMLTFLNSTLTENTGGALGAGGVFLFNSTTTATNTVIAGNTGGAGDFGGAGSLTAASSLFGTGAPGVANGEDGNLAGTTVSPLDPKLGNLADNGGPVQTQAILAGSPLIGAGNAALLPDDDFDLDGDSDKGEDLPLDARGNARVLDGALDIGAAEANQLIVSTASDSASAGNDVGASLAADIADGGGLSLREAIAWAGTGETIVFASGLAGETIVLEQGQLVLDKDIFIIGDMNGDRKADITISGNDATRIFDITGTGTEVELRSLTLTDGNAGAPNNGGAIQAQSGTTLTVIDSTISDSQARDGGGIYADAATLRVVNSTLTGNEAFEWGGGVRVAGGGASFVNATIHDNEAGGTGGGGIDATAAMLTILSSTITENTGGAGGAGGLYLNSSTATVHNSVIAGNTGGVGDFFNPGSLTAASSFFGTTVAIGTDQGGNINGGGDPLLGALADNGGPVQTRAILQFSPLIGAGNAALLPDDDFDLDGDGVTAGEKLPLDARGLARVQGGALDIGAFEVVPNTAPVLTDVASSVTFLENTVNAAPRLLDADVTFTDPDDNFDGGSLVVAGLLAEDSVSIRNEGTGAGEIGFDLNTGEVRFGNTVIGNAAGGNAGTNLTVTFNATATSAAIEALIQNLTYSNSSDTPTASRTLTITVTDATGAVTLAEPSFAEVTGPANPFDGIAIGFDLAPAFADLDGDGDLDLVVGESFGDLVYFLNTGSASAPVFVQQTGAANPFDGINVELWATPAFADLDGDGDLDLVIGDRDSHLHYFLNTGSGFAPQTGAANPFDGIDVGDPHSAPALADLDGDGDFDVVIGSNSGTLHYFLNTGTASAPAFVQQAGALNPFDGINGGPEAKPTLADVDGDGDLDLVVGERSGALHYFLNTGTASAPAFVQQTGAANPFDGIDVGRYSKPTFADVDGDGDIDLVLGEEDGNLNFFRNGAANIPLVVNVTAENDAPVLAGLDSPVTFLENIVNITPQLLDADVTFIDPEGNFDGGTLRVTGLLAEDRVSIRNQGTGAGQIGLSGSNVTFGGDVIGTVTGGAAGSDLTVAFTTADATAAAIEALIQNLTYANASDTPTASRTLTITVTDAAGAATLDLSQPSFTEVIGAANPFDGFNVGIRSAPVLVDFDNDGDLDLVVGNNSGTLSYFQNTAGAFTQQTGANNPFDGIDAGANSTPALVDIDGDNDLDLVVGNHLDGTLKYYRNDGGTFAEQTGAGNPFNGITGVGNPNPAFADLDGDGDLDLVLGDLVGTDGSLSYFRNDGGVFVPQTGPNNPFDGINAGTAAAPALADLDGDGDIDLTVGRSNGDLVYYRNDSGAFVQQGGANNPFTGVNVGVNSNPTFGDLDGDGDLDLVVGEQDGNLHFVRNDAAGIPIVVNVTAQNGAPVLTGVRSAATFAENTVNATPQRLDSNVTLTDPESNFDGGTVRVTGLLAEDRVSILDQGTGAGQIGVSGSTVSFGGTAIGTKSGGNGKALQVTLNAAATTAAVEALVEHLTYANVSNTPTASRTLTVMVRDDASGSASAPITVHVTAQNDAPVLTGVRSAATFAENTVNATPRLLDSNVTLRDAEGNFDGGTVRVTGLLAEDRVSILDQGTGAGQIGVSGSTVSFGGTAIGTKSGGNGKALQVTLNAAATTAAVEALVEHLTYANVSNTATASRTLNVTVRDNASGSTSAPIVVNVTAQNDAPILTGVRSTVTFAENTVNVTPQRLDSNVTVRDAEGNFNGGTVRVTGLLAEDRVAILNQGTGAGQIGLSGSTVSFGGTAIGTMSGGNGKALQVTLNAAATTAAVEVLVEHLTYANVSNTPTASRTLTVRVQDNASGSTSAPIVVNVTAQNDAPILTGVRSAVTFAENAVNATPRLLDSNVTLRDAEGNFNGGTLRVTGLLAEDRVAILDQGTIGLNGSAVTFGGTKIGTVSGGNGKTLTVTFNKNATAAGIEALTEHLTYANVSNTPTASRTLNVTVRDNASGSTSAPITVNVTAQNDAPVLTGVRSAVTFLENTVNLTPQRLDSNVTLRDAEGNLNGGTVRVTGLLAEDTVSVRNQGTGAGQIGLNGNVVTFGGTAIGTVSGGNGKALGVTLNAAATVIAVEALIENLTYANASDAPAASRVLTITVRDNAAGLASAAITVNVTNESDIGATIVGSNKADLINGTKTVAGQPRPTNLNDTIFGNDGDDDLSGLFGRDTIQGGNGRDILRGDGGDDILNGGKGDDILQGGEGDDILQVRDAEGLRDIFHGGAGTDTLQFLGDSNAWLSDFDASKSSIEILKGNGRGLNGTRADEVFDLSGLKKMTGVPFVDGKGGKDILIGSRFADELRGGGGNDILDGRAGKDVLWGGDGRDTFVFADGYGSDTIIDYRRGQDIIDLRGVLGVDDFGDLVLTQIAPQTVLVDFDGIAGGDTLKIQQTTIAILTANQGDFLFY